MEKDQSKVDVNQPSFHRYPLHCLTAYREWIRLVKTDIFHKSMLGAVGLTLGLWMLHSFITIFTGEYGLSLLWVFLV